LKKKNEVIISAPRNLLQTTALVNGYNIMALK